MLDSEAADNAETEASQMEQLKMTVARLEDERKILIDENTQLKEMLKREVNKAEANDKKNSNIINDYKLVRQRLEMQLFSVKAELDILKEKISDCERCNKLIENNKNSENISKSNGDQCKENLPSDQLKAIERIRELELELAQTKLAQVEAECRNQDLTHQLRATESELNTAKNSWPPWLSRTLTSIKEVANKKDFAHFAYPHTSIPTSTPSFISHINIARRESAPIKSSDSCDELDSRRESAPNIKDSQSCSSLKAQN